MSLPDILALASEEAPRVVPISASQSLYASTDTVSASPDAVSTGLPRLDQALCPDSTEDAASSTPGHSPLPPRGLCCGQVTEVYGPPGVGKTSLALCAAVSALRDRRKVVWIDTMSPLPGPRLKKMLRKALLDSADPTDQTGTSEEDLTQNLIYFRTPSLPHLLALLLRPPKDFPPNDTALLVVDSISGLFPSYLPNPTELRARFAQSNITDRSQIQWLMSRRWNITSDLANQLMRLATTRRLAVLVTNQTHTKIRGQPRATLCPVLVGGSWESNISTRVVLYRDFLTVFDDGDDDGGVHSTILTNVRFAEIMKRSGKTLALRLEGNIIPFIIESDGLREMEKKSTPGAPLPAPQRMQQPQQPLSSQPASQRKRKIDEVADSQDEDEDDSDGEYGWAQGDDADLLENPTESQ